MHGTTVQRSGETELSRTRCDRCGELGHMARACPRPPTCFKCGQTGHQAFRCPQGGGHKVITTKGGGHKVITTQITITLKSYSHSNFRSLTVSSRISRSMIKISNFVTYVKAMVTE